MTKQKETKMTTQHTPLPWYQKEDAPRYCINAGKGDAEKHIAMVSCFEHNFGDKQENEANTAFIVKSANNHDNLLSHLRASNELLKTIHSASTHKETRFVLNQMIALNHDTIARAEGK